MSIEFRRKGKDVKRKKRGVETGQGKLWRGGGKGIETGKGRDVKRESSVER